MKSPGDQLRDNRYYDPCSRGQMTTQRQVRAAFWREHRSIIAGITSRRITNYSGNGKMYNTDTRCAFANFVDHLSRNGEISQALMQRVTL